MKTCVCYAVYDPYTNLFRSQVSNKDWTESLRKAYLYKFPESAVRASAGVNTRLVRVIMHTDMELL